MSGRMVRGEWVTQDVWADNDGEFRRQEVTFRDRIEVGGTHAPERGRYHLFVSYACPWAHRTLIVRTLKGLEDAISVSVVNPLMLNDGWTFNSADGVVADPDGAPFLRDIYRRAKPDFTGRVTVPVLWDKKLGVIVNNESSEILRDFNGPMSTLSATPEQAALDLYPERLRAEIDRVNARVYATVNNGVYRCGFATSQRAYDTAFDELFASLDWLEGLLTERRFLAGDVVTEADWRLFTTLVRFDAVYVTHFKCNLRRIADYPKLSAFVATLYKTRGVAETVRIDHIKAHYFGSHRAINPSGIIPRGPALAFLDGATG